MRVVIDTNVLVSGLLSPFGAPAEVVRLIARGSLFLCYDVRILTEYADVLSRPKFSFPAEQIQAPLDQIRAVGHSVASDPLALELPDPDDEPFLATAMAGNARCLITGNTKHFPSSRRQGMAVLSPGEFIELYRKTTRKQRPKR